MKQYQFKQITAASLKEENKTGNLAEQKCCPLERQLLQKQKQTQSNKINKRNKTKENRKPTRAKMLSSEATAVAKTKTVPPR